MESLRTMAKHDLGLNKLARGKEELLSQMCAAYNLQEKGESTESAELAVEPVEGDSELRIRCKAPKGRWRAGRYWKCGVNKANASELSEEDLEKLDRDPMFRVYE
jgi:hypothetical protein